MTALLLIDIQNDYFINGAMALDGAEGAGNNAGKVLANFRRKGLPVFHIQHIATRGDATFFLPNTNGAEFNNSVSPISSEPIVIKHFPNSFRETELLAQLQQQHISHLVICGMMSHVCVDSTVRAAKDFGFNCTLISDACATKDLFIHEALVKASEVQKSFMAALSYFYATVLTTETYLLVE